MKRLDMITGAEPVSRAGICRSALLLKKLGNVVVLEAVLVKKLSELPVLLGHTPGCELDLGTGRNPLELKVPKSLLQFGNVLPPPSSRPSLVVSDASEVGFLLPGRKRGEDVSRTLFSNKRRLREGKRGKDDAREEPLTAGVDI